jgi:hypothetical protein
MPTQILLIEDNPGDADPESAFENLTDGRIREITETRIKECRTKLRQLQGRPSIKPLMHHRVQTHEANAHDAALRYTISDSGSTSGIESGRPRNRPIY